jgi:putative peptidoglycan lipid II flippase
MAGMLKSTAATATATLISRILGLVREMAYARFMGNGWVASAFLFAFQIPNLFRRLLGEGALSVAFIPLFKEKERTAGDSAMWQAANAVISGLILAALALVVLVMAGVSVVLWQGEFATQTQLMLDLLRWMFPYAMLVCMAAIGIGMLDARGQFFIPALGAAVLNVVLIASAVWWAPRLDGGLPRQVYALAFGVLIAGFIQALFPIPFLMRTGWRYRWIAPWNHPDVREVLRRMAPTTIGAAAYQLNIVITQGFAFFLGESIVASFQYAVRLMELPQGLFGVSLATYLLPTLAGLAADRRFADFRATLLRGLSYLFLVNALASGLLMGLATPIVRLLFEGGLFRESATQSVSFALVFLAPGLAAVSGSSILARAFYAMGETRVPMQIGVFCLGMNTVLSVLFALPLHEAGLALANTLTSTTNLLLLGYALRRRLPELEFAALRSEGWRVAGAAAFVTVLVWWMAAAWEKGFGHEGLWVRVGAVFVPAFGGALVYFGALWGLRLPACREVMTLVLERWRRWAG